MEPIGGDASAVQEAVRRYLGATDRPGDVDRMAQRLAFEHSRGTYVVGFRREGREVFVWEASDHDDQTRLAIEELARDGRLYRRAIVWRGDDLRRWLRENHHYLEWVAPCWRRGGRLDQPSSR